MTQTHSHIFDEGNPLAEKKTQWTVILTAAMMVFEIIGGWYFNSMALLSDGWHMSSHALALGLSVFTYKAARWFADDPRFAFGTWKMEVLGGYSSAILLLGVAGLMAFQSIERLIAPQAIHYDEAIGIAGLGLLVNLVCALLLHDKHSHGHSHDHHHHDHDHSHHHHHHHDLNLRSAYVHVLSDAATSVLAIVALIGGKYWGFAWLDPAMGIAGAILVAVWAVGLLKETGRVLLDAEMDAPVVAEVREAIASCPGNAEITDLHVWRVGRGKYACILSIAVNGPAEPDEFRRQLSIHEELVHITVEVNQRSG